MDNKFSLCFHYGEGWGVGVNIKTLHLKLQLKDKYTHFSFQFVLLDLTRLSRPQAKGLVQDTRFQLLMASEPQE